MRRRAKVRLSPSDLAGVLEGTIDLRWPLGVHVIGFYEERDPPGLYVMVEGDALAEIEDQVEAPMLRLERWERNSYRLMVTVDPPPLLGHRMVKDSPQA